MKSLGIYTRILLMLALTGFIFLLLLSTLYFFKNKQENLILDSSKDQFDNEVNSILSINKAKLKQVAYDYTFWDEFAENIIKNDTAWYTSNITSIINSFHFEYVCVYDTGFNIVHEASSKDVLSRGIIQKEALAQLKKKGRFLDFFQFTPDGLFEISGASVHFTNDPTHLLTKPSGFFFVAKKWDRNFINDLSALCGAEINVMHIDTLPTVNEYSIFASKSLLGWQGEQIAQVFFVKSYNVFKLYQEMTVYMFIVIIVSIVITLLIFHYSTRKWISKPLKMMTSVLKDENPVLLKKLQNAPGEFKQIGILISDFINQKGELKNAKEKAEESERLKTAFLANMSHEIRTPMNGILGFASLLKEPMLTGEQQQKYIDIIESSGERMLNIINDLINISKVEAGQMKVNISETNINKQIEYICTFFKPEAERKGIKLLYKTILPEHQAIIETDSEKIYAILTNLVKNAIKFTDKGIIEIGYTLRQDQGSEKLNNEQVEFQFFVKDTGIGILKEKQQAIFDRFIQADVDNKRAFQGAGLGLSITKAYVELIGGRIWLDSIPDKGSQFYFTIPYRPKTKLLHQTIPIESEIKRSNPSGGLTILIVDDEELVDAYLSMIVKDISTLILHARDGYDAVEICRKNRNIDFVLMDIQLPRMNGYEATEQIRTFNKDVIIISQTAYALSGDRQKAIDAGCNDYITKPIKKETLLAMIGKYFKK